MRKILVFIPIILFAAVSLTAGPVEDEVIFRKRMNAWVSEGNRQYDRGNRSGIAAMVDSLGRGIRTRSTIGLLSRTDSLEYTADLFKLCGDWYYENGFYDDSSYSFDRAEAFFLKAMQIYRNPEMPFERDLDKIPLLHRELAQLYYKQTRFPEALSSIRAASKAYEDAFMNQEFLVGDVLWEEWKDIQMQEAICVARVGQAVKARREMDSLISLLPKKSALYYEGLRKKAKIIMLSGAVGREKSALPFYKTFFQWKQRQAISVLATMSGEDRQDFWMRTRPFLADCFCLEGEDPGFLFDAALFNKGLLLQLNLLEQSSRELNSLMAGWKDIQKKLQADACAIEIIQYEKDGLQRLGAIVLRPRGVPQWVELMAPDEFFAYMIDGKSNRERIYTTSGREKDSLYNSMELRKLLWTDKLLSAVGNSKRVYLSPDGYFHQIAVEYMLPEGWEGKEIYRLTSTRQLLFPRKVHTDAALLVGGVDYEEEVPGDGEWNDELAYYFIRESMEGRRIRFKYLDGTEKESETILAYRDSRKDTLITGSVASEEVVRSLIGRYPVVSIATHGSFRSAGLPQGTDLKPCHTDETLSENVLVLAGASNSLNDLSFNPYKLDGLLSAAEIASLDLTHLDVVVLSACQTGMGWVTSDGVFGLQRGFKNAGAGCIIVSLWSVDDDATMEMVSRFHRNLIQGMSVHKAFQSAREYLLSETAYPLPPRTVFNPITLTTTVRRGTKDLSAPQYANAFILIDSLE